MRELITAKILKNISFILLEQALIIELKKTILESADICRRS